MTNRSMLALAALSSLFAGCSGSTAPTEAPAAELRLESGVLTGAGERTDRSRPELANAEWVTALHAETVPGSQSGSWHSDLRLTNGTRLLVATSGTPELRFPEGFAVPVAQILEDIPAAWRGAELVSAADAASAVERIQWRLELFTKPVVPKRLYVLALTVTEDPPGGSEAAAAGPAALSPLPGSIWPVPPGPHVFRKQLSNVVEFDATVHAAVAAMGPHARSLRLSDATDGKVLWEATVTASDDGAGRIAPFQSDNGFPIYREHVYELEAEYDNPGTEPCAGAATIFLYYRLPGNESVSYPFPPPKAGGD